jgi:hypothetical protein
LSKDGVIWTLVALLFVRTFGGAIIRLLIALGASVVAANADEIPAPVLVVLGLVTVTLWIATVGSFVLAVADIAHNW